MKKILCALVVIVALVCTLASCNVQIGTSNEPTVPSIAISEDGYWIINGEKTNVKAQGEKGDKGDQGIQGDAGRGILKVEIIDGDMWITYTDDPDTPVNVGSVPPEETTIEETTPEKPEEIEPSDPYNGVTRVSIKELRTNREAYEGVKVAVEGVIAQDTNGTLYIEQLDEEDGNYYGMQVYYGYNIATSAKRFLKTGNLVYLVGTFQYAEVVNAYQIAGLEYDQMKPGDPAFTHLIESEQVIPYTEITNLADFTTGKTDVIVGEETVSMANNALALHTSVSLTNLKVVDTYTTTKETSDDKGAISLTCEKDGVTITIRTIVLYENGVLVTADRFEGKTIDVKGIVDAYTPEGSTNEQIQIRVFSLDAITIH